MLSDLPKINQKETKIIMEKALTKYRVLLLTQSLGATPKITANYSLAPPTQTNRFYSTTESTAINNINYEIERENYINKVAAGVNRLSEKEREVIIERYIREDETFDYEVYNVLGYSERTYYRIKKKALQNLAIILKIVVYK